jgi:hypothetical protein
MIIYPSGSANKNLAAAERNEKNLDGNTFTVPLDRKRSSASLSCFVIFGRFKLFA